MADALLHLVCKMPSVTGFSEDVTEVTVNCAQMGVLGPGMLTQAVNAYRDFWITLATGQTTRIGAYLSSTISRTTNACTILAYASLAMDGTTPLGSPDATLSFTMTAVGAGSEQPREVAACLSYNGDLTDVPVSSGSTRPQSRRRGRMYIGPIKTSAGAGDTAGIYRVAPAFRTDCTQAFKGFCDAVKASSSVYRVGVWSKADANVYPAVSCSMDDAWDTQRRRGLGATAKTVLAV